MGTAARAQAEESARENRLKAAQERRLQLDPDQVARDKRIRADRRGPDGPAWLDEYERQLEFLRLAEVASDAGATTPVRKHCRPLGCGALTGGFVPQIRLR